MFVIDDEQMDLEQPGPSSPPAIPRANDDVIDFSEGGQEAALPALLPHKKRGAGETRHKNDDDALVFRDGPDEQARPKKGGGGGGGWWV